MPGAGVLKLLEEADGTEDDEGGEGDGRDTEKEAAPCTGSLAWEQVDHVETPDGTALGYASYGLWQGDAFLSVTGMAMDRPSLVRVRFSDERDRHGDSRETVTAERVFRVNFAIRSRLRCTP